MSRTTHLPTSRADEVLDQLGRLALEEGSLDGLLQRAVRIVGSVQPAGAETSLALRTAVSTHAAGTDARALRLDEGQGGPGGGPAVHCARTGTVTEVVDARVDARWPAHAAAAVAAGLLSSLSVPLSVDARTGGALTVWAPDARAFDPSTRLVVLRLAPHVQAAVAGMQDRASATWLADDLDVALESRAVIGQARAMLVERHGLSPERATEMMVRMSARNGVAVRDVAAGLIRTEQQHP
jgi:hypothetical protein